MWADPTSPNLTNESPLTMGWWDSPASSCNGEQTQGYRLDYTEGQITYSPAPIHGSIHPGGTKGRVVLFESSASGFFVFDLDASGPSGGISRTPVNTTITNQQIYCAGHVVLPNGDLPVFGGDWWDNNITKKPADPWAAILDIVPSPVTYSSIAPMPGLARYYPTCTELPNGDVLVWGGDYWVGDLNSNGVIDFAERVDNDTWLKFHMEGDSPQAGVWTEVLNPLTREGTDRKIILDRVQLYPYTQLIPNSTALASDLSGGGLLWAGPFWQNEIGQGYKSRFFKLDSNFSPANVDPIQDPRHYETRGACSMVQLALEMPNPVPRVILLGGGQQFENNQDQTVAIVEMWRGDQVSASRWNDGNVSDMNFKRHDPNAVLLPTGQVFASGGHSCPCQFENENDEHNHPYITIPSKVCELFDPGASASWGGQWSLADTMGTIREYHSVAMLLPDGRVVAAGGEPTDATTHCDRQSYEIYYPPYLFINASGTVRLRTPSERPSIGAISGHGPAGTTEIYYGYDFEFDVSGINLSSGFKVVLMRPCSVTHSNDMHQRSIVLEKEMVSSTRVKVKGTFQNDDAPPGPYMLCILNTSSSNLNEHIPSVAKWITIKPGTLVAGSGNTTWSGTMTISSDVYVQPGDTLFVGTGTYKFPSTGGTNHAKGKDPNKVEVIVEGVMKVTASTSSPATFKASLGGPSLSQWYGIRVAPGGKLVVDNHLGLQLQNARAPLAWEQPTFPDPSWVDDKIGFTNTFVRVSFDRDVTVPASVNWQVPAGWKIGFEPGDKAASGKDIALAELIVLGSLNFAGTSGSPIELKSAIVSPNPSTDRWFGLRYLDSTNNSLNSLTNVNFNLAKYALSLDSLSGNLFGCTFANSELGDIYVDRDTRVPQGYSFSIDAPCKVVVNSDDPAVPTHWGEDPDRVEWWVYGAVRTKRPSGGSGVVEFTSTDQDMIRGDDWYGMTFVGTGANDGVGVASLKNAVFGYAKYPLSFWFADSAEVASSAVHHYEEDAITDWGSDAWIHDCFVERGAGLTDDPLDAAGINGIRVVGSFTTVERDTILYQINNGVWVDGSSGYCLGTPSSAPAGTILIKDCVILGDATETANTTCNGVLADYICHEEQVTVEGNSIQNWAGGRGIHLDNSSDAAVKCNCVQGNKVGLKHDRKFRTVTSTNGINKARQNNFALNTESNVKANWGPGNHSSGLWVGVNGNSSTGENRFLQYLEDRYNYELLAFEYDRVDSLEMGKWYNHLGQSLTVAADINAENFYNTVIGQELDVDPWSNASDPACSTGDDDCGLTGITGRFGTVVGRQSLLAGDLPARPGDILESEGVNPVPSSFGMRLLGANPVQSEARIAFDVPANVGGEIGLSIFDVTGRRVADLLDGQSTKPGRHSATWRLVESGTKRVSPGIYFVRMTAPGFSQTHKLVVLR